MTSRGLEVEGLRVSFPVGSGLFHRDRRVLEAVAGVDIGVRSGETVGLVGESGCGKTTVARSLVGLERPSTGAVRLDGIDVAGLTGHERAQARRAIQMVFQDPYSSLNPRMTVGQLVAEGWEIHQDLVPAPDRPRELARLLGLVGLEPEMADRYPHQFSGGQRQRIGIARALAVRPRFLVCDEPVSALDVSIQAQILNLLADLQEELGIAYLFISHDLSVVRHVADRVAVMYLGRIVEEGPTEAVFTMPAHPYTVALLSAVLPIDPDAELRQRIILQGDVPSPLDPPSGCRFRTRCWLRERLGDPERCTLEDPSLTKVDNAEPHRVACHFTTDIDRSDIPPASAPAEAELQSMGDEPPVGRAPEGDQVVPRRGSHQTGPGAQSIRS